MTKAELTAAIKDFPDDMEVRFVDQYDTWTCVYPRQPIDKYTNKKYIELVLS